MISSKTFGLTPWYTHLVNQYGWSVPICLGVAGVGVLLVALAIRTVIYLAVRLSGQKRYTPFWQGVENFCVFLMFLFGGLVGFLTFGNLLSAGLCGAGFAFVGLGISLQAITANDNHQVYR